MSHEDISKTVRKLQKDLASLQERFDDLRDICEGLVITCQTFDVQNRKIDENIQFSAGVMMSLLSISSVCKEIRLDQMNMFIAANPDIAEKYDIEAGFMSCGHGASLKAWWGNAAVDIEIPFNERTHRLFAACYGVTVGTLKRYCHDERLLKLLSQRFTLYKHLPDQFHALYDLLCESLVDGKYYEETLEMLLGAVDFTLKEILHLELPCASS
ncbi:hypothetical protein TWF730_006992 [Orbilia blumenaviensis]|uniref:Uncharacterized protein n=1 Tax=Orbilia blumenaviensis TaxID=1796055 RepID=A0AAV9VIU7_9PEZI